jgi:hypothetical protein
MEMVMRKTYVLFLFLFFLSACSKDSVFQGISRDSGYDAKIEDAAIALDNSQYDSVIASLAVIYNTTAPDPAMGRLLASAYMGNAWLDVNYFVAGTAATNADSFDVLAAMIHSSDSAMNTRDGQRLIGHDDNNQTDAVIVTDLIDYSTKAKTALQALVQYDLATEDDIIQLGIASAAHFIYYLGSKTADAMNVTLSYVTVSEQKPGLVPVPINTAAYAYYRTSSVTDFKYDWARVSPASFIDKTATGTPSYQEDLINIHQAVLAFAESYPKPNEMRDNLDALLHSALGKSSDVTITDALIMKYTTKGVYTYVQTLANQ